MAKQISLLLGGARSGKSALASELADQTRLPVIYIATATALDPEMMTRIQRHQQERPAHWQLVEEPRDLAGAIRALDGTERCLIIDCLTLWLSNLLHDEQGNPRPSAQLESHFSELASTLVSCEATIILVSNEVGLGVIPLGELTRRFVDEAGRLNQRLAQLAHRVLFVAAGLPLVLKDQTLSTNHD